jgi:TolB-like protein
LALIPGTRVGPYEVTAQIINALAHIPGLKVIARTSSFAFRGKEQDVRVIAEVLGVGHVLEGSVRKAGNRIRVTAQLIAAADGSPMWSERYDRELADVFAIQDEIAEAITAALQIRLTAAAAASRVHRPTLPAYEAFLKGRHLLLAATCARTDHQDQADVLLVGMQPVGVVIYHALCSEFDASADWFKIVLDTRDAIGTLLAAMSCWAPLRAGPCWPKLATMMNLRAAK